MLSGINKGFTIYKCMLSHLQRSSGYVGTSRRPFLRKQSRIFLNNHSKRYEIVFLEKVCDFVPTYPDDLCKSDSIHL